MSTNKNLFKEAIADAKAVREAALANAKVALEEALTPKLQSMLSAKLQEMESYEENAMGGYTDEGIQGSEENLKAGMKVHPHGQQEKILTIISPDGGFGGKVSVEDEKGGKFSYDAQDLEIVEGINEEEDLEEDFDLSEILAELNEADEEEAEEEGEEEEDEEEEEEESEEGENVADMSVEDLKDLIKSIVDQELEAEEAETPAEEEAEYADGEEAGEEVGNEDEIDLEELLAELDSLGENDDDIMEAKKKAKDAKKAKEEKEEMKEAVATINALRKEMNEVNLLNAKLLYVNKIFKAKNLTESQKVKVIASFDKATNVKEAKVVFESLNSALRAPAKRTIKESFGFASKASGVAQNRTIVESNDAIKRMQKLANIIK
jgi:hypothetical protein